ncbi:serine hydroxymethyltransferase [Holotrichia oblita]|nr:serine hydroxymethyltransferase [Holotrichia oblita]
MKIAIGSDHRGFSKKAILTTLLSNAGYEVVDVGCFSEEKSNHIIFGLKVGELVAKGKATYGVLICGSGIGISIAANKVKGVRCALVYTKEQAVLTRAHNNANIVAMSEAIDDEVAKEIATAFITSPFLGGVYGERVDTLIHYEQKAVGSILTNKYAEGYPGKRYYGGCEYVDEIERIAIEKACQLFNCEHANVQPHSGSQANMAVYLAILKPGDKVLAMDLASGGHLSHGHRLSFSGQLYDFHFYGVDPVSKMIDVNEVRRLAHQIKPKLIVVGASAYYRIIPFPAFRQIADEVGAYLMADVAHIAGLIAASIHPSPFPHAHFVTTTTHKTLRGPRGGMILCDKQYGALIDRAVFPGVQGGPLMHIIAGKAVAFEEALAPEFKKYQQNVVDNAATLANEFISMGVEVVSGQTDAHMLVINTMSSFKISGKEAQQILDDVLITVNKNSIPYDPLPPGVTSGIRIGTPALTTRGFNATAFRLIAILITVSLRQRHDDKSLIKIKKIVRMLNRQFR